MLYTPIKVLIWTLSLSLSLIHWHSLCQYFHGSHHFEEVTMMENITRSQLLTLIDNSCAQLYSVWYALPSHAQLAPLTSESPHWHQTSSLGSDSMIFWSKTSVPRVHMHKFGLHSCILSMVGKSTGDIVTVHVWLVLWYLEFYLPSCMCLMLLSPKLYSYQIQVICCALKHVITFWQESSNRGASGSPNGVIGGPGPPMFRPTDIVMYCIITHSN